MKNLYYKKQTPQEETPMLQPLKRSHTLLHALASEANSEWQQLTTLNKSTGRASNGSYRENFTSIGSDEGTPSFVIKDTDLASSWIYTKRKAAASSDFESISSEPMSPPPAHVPKQDSEDQDIESPQLEFKRIPIAPRMKPKSSCCCYMFVLVIIFISFLGILSSVGGILYLEIFTANPKLPISLNTTIMNNMHAANIVTVTSDSTESASSYVVEHSTTELENITVNMNLFQARRGDWGHEDDDDYDETTASSLASTTTVLNNSADKILVAAHNANEVYTNVDETSGNTSLSRMSALSKDRTTTAMSTINGPDIKHTTKLQQESTTNEKFTETPSRNFTKSSDSILQNDVTFAQNMVNFQSNTPKISTSSTVDGTKFFKTSHPRTTSASNTFRTSKMLLTANETSSNLPFSHVSSTRQEPAKISDNVRSTPLLRPLQAVTIESTPKIRRKNSFSDLQMFIVPVFKQLQQLDKKDIVPHSRMRNVKNSGESLSKFQQSTVKNVTRNAAGLVFPTLNEKEKEKYLDKLRDIYFNQS